MVSYTQAAMERAMKVQEVILRAMAKKITWWQAAEIIGISDRQMLSTQILAVTGQQIECEKARRVPTVKHQIFELWSARRQGRRLFIRLPTKC